MARRVRLLYRAGTKIAHLEVATGQGFQAGKRLDSTLDRAGIASHPESRRGRFAGDAGRAKLSGSTPEGHT